MTDYSELVTRLRRDGIAARDTLKCAELAPTVDPEDALEAADAIEAQAKLIAELEDAFREIYEVYAGSEGFIPETCAEAHQQQLIKEMSDIAAKHMRKGKNNG